MIKVKKKSIKLFKCFNSEVTINYLLKFKKQNNFNIFLLLLIQLLFTIITNYISIC